MDILFWSIFWLATVSGVGYVCTTQGRKSGIRYAYPLGKADGREEELNRMAQACHVTPSALNVAIVEKELFNQITKKPWTTTT